MTALVVVVIAHQFVMLLPAHAHVVEMLAHASHGVAASHECEEPCPPATIEQCSATVAAFRAAFAFALALVALALLPVAPTSASRVSRSRREWLWPPDRRRAFLQVFLC